MKTAFWASLDQFDRWASSEAQQFTSKKNEKSEILIHSLLAFAEFPSLHDVTKTFFTLMQRRVWKLFPNTSIRDSFHTFHE